MRALPRYRQDEFHQFARRLSNALVVLQLRLLAWSTGNGRKTELRRSITFVRGELNELEKELDR